MNTVSLPDGTKIHFPDDTSEDKMSEVASGLWKQITAKPSKPAEPTPTGPPEVSTLPEQSVQLGGGRPAPPAQSFGAKSVWQNVTTPIANFPPEAIAQQLRFNPSQPAIGMALAALPPKLREDIIKGVSEGVAQNVVDPFLSPLGAGTMLAGGAIPKVAQKAMQIGFGVLGGMGVPGTVKRLTQAKTPGEASKELIGLGAEGGMVVGGVKGLAEGVAAVLPRTRAALSQVKPTTERPENAEREIAETGGVPAEQRVAPERVAEGQVEAGAPQRGGEGAPQAPNAPEGQARNVLAPASELDALQTIRDAGMPLSDQQQARLSELEKAAAPPPVRPEGEPTRVAAAAATTEPSGPGAAVTAAPPAASVSEATTSQQVKQAAVEKQLTEPGEEATITLEGEAAKGRRAGRVSQVVEPSKILTQKEVDKLGTAYEKARGLYGDNNLETQRRFQKWFNAAKTRKEAVLARESKKQAPPLPPQAEPKQAYQPKEPWQMTLEEFGGPKGGSLKRLAGDVTYRQHNKDWHHRFVAQALIEGKPVPPEVLADYPDLKKQAEPQTAPEGGATKGAEAAAAQPDFVGLGAAAAGEETGRPTIGELIPSRAGTAPTPAPTTAESSVLQRVGQLFSRESMRDTGRALAGTLGTVLGKTLPKITNLSRSVGELGARYISSRIYARYAAPIFSRDVMAGLNIDPVKFGAALSEDNLRSIKEAHLRKASESTDPTEQARLNEMANNVFSFVGERGTFRTEAEYQDYLRRPEVQEAIRRHISNWKAVIEPQYREAMMLDPELELPERGLQTGARVNLAPVLEGRPIPPGAVWSSRPGSLLGTLRRKSPFGVLAKGTGEAYIPNYDDLIANTFFKQTEIANKNAFDKALVEQGLAVIDKPGQHPVVGGEQTVAFPLTRRTVVIPGEGAVGQNQMIYVRRSLAKEYRVASNVDANPYEGFIATKINNAFSQAALAGLTDATVHVSNLSTSLAQLPVSKLSLLTDTLLSAAIRSELPVVAARAIKKGGPEVAGGLLKRSPLLKKITPDRVVRAIEDAYWKNQTQLASLAEIGALKEPHVLSNLPPLKQMSQLIQWYDRTTRMVLDDAYTDLAQRGVVENTETARREFINQVGQYNKRAQGAIVRFFRQSGLGPFITAGRAFNVLGARAATLSPGVKATSPMMALALRVNALAKWTGTLSFVALMNYLITGKTTGTPGTPIGSISSNDKDELGRNKSFSVINLTGQGRALRVTGLRGFIEAKRKGLPTPVAEDAAMRDIVNSAIGPMAGPAIRGAFVAATGQAPAVNISRVSRVVPPGESQTAENIKTALLEANPVIAGAVESGKPGKSWKDAVARQLPRFTMQVTQPERMIQDYPIIVRKAQANAYIDDVIHRARRIENSQERWKFITDSILKLSPEDQAHAWLTIRFRKVE